MKKILNIVNAIFLRSPAVQFDSLSNEIVWLKLVFDRNCKTMLLMNWDIWKFQGRHQLYSTLFLLASARNCLVQIIIKFHPRFFSLFFTNLMHCYWPYWVRTHVQQALKLLLFQFDCFYVPFNFKCLENQITQMFS